jgi:hypothetical protein
LCKRSIDINQQWDTKPGKEGKRQRIFFLSGAGKMGQFDYSEVHYVNYASLAASQRKTSISFITYEPI